MLICSSKNVVACRAGLKKVAICFQQQKLWGCLLFNEVGNSFPKLFRAADPASTVAVPPSERAVSEANWLRKNSWTPGPFLLFSSLLRFTAESTKTSSILILAFPLRGVGEALQMSLQGYIVKAVIKTKKLAPVGTASQILWEPWAVRLFLIPALKCLAFKPSDKLCSCRLLMGKILWSDCHC